MLKKITLLIFFILLFSVITTAPGFSQTENPDRPTDDEVNAIAKQLFCPVCENIPLDVCPTQACEEWRELIRLKLSEGWSEEQIKTYFAEQYGARVLSSPPAKGFNILIYAFLAIGLIIGIGIVVFVLYWAYFKPSHSVERIPMVEDSTPGGLDQDYVDRLERDLRNR